MLPAVAAAAAAVDGCCRTVLEQTPRGLSCCSSEAEPKRSKPRLPCHGGMYRPASGLQPETLRPRRQRPGRHTDLASSQRGCFRGAGRTSGRRREGDMWAASSGSYCLLFAREKMASQTAAADSDSEAEICWTQPADCARLWNLLTDQTLVWMPFWTLLSRL